MANSNLKKYLAEFLGTFALVLFGCGTATFNNAIINANQALSGAGVVLVNVCISLAFGLTLAILVYIIGRISGCHVNPAVSLAMAINKKISWKDFLGYVISQIAGAICACGVISAIIISATGTITTISSLGLGQNGYNSASAFGINMWGAIVVEVILTFIFVLAVFGATKDNDFKGSGIVIGIALTVVHILGIPLTGTSVNPARSIAPALFVGGEALS
ncbi:MAG: aquaporin, partial [Clostridia bacterium]